MVLLQHTKKNTKILMNVKKTIKYIVENGFITNSIYQEINQTTRETSKRDLKKLTDAGITKSSDYKNIVKYELNI